MSDTPKQKLLFLITKSNWGGAQRYVYEMATAMQGEFEVAVGCGGNGTMREKLEAAGVPVYEVDGWQRNVNPLKELQSWSSLYRLLKQEQPDIIHLNSSKAGLSGALIGRLAGVKNIVFTIHGWPFLEPRPFWWRALTWCGMYATTLLVHTLIPISHYDVAHAHMPFVRRKYTDIIYNAVPPIAFVPAGEARRQLVGPELVDAHSEPWLTTIAELHPKKNIGGAITAVADHNKTHPEEPIFYLIIGDGVLRKTLQTQIETEKMTDHIMLLGHVTDARQYLKAADMFLLPSFQEGLPYALLEAGAAGLPTIASNVCGIPEVIHHDENGLLFEPKNTKILAAALTRLVSDTVLQTRLGDAFLEGIETNYTLAEMVKKTTAAYQHRLRK